MMSKTETVKNKVEEEVESASLGTSLKARVRVDSN